MTLRDRAKQLAETVRLYLDNTALEHYCAGYGCKICQLDGTRIVELTSELAETLQGLANEGREP